MTALTGHKGSIELLSLRLVRYPLKRTQRSPLKRSWRSPLILVLVSPIEATSELIMSKDQMAVETCKASIIKYYKRRRFRKYIPEEIWFEILSRLPIKSLLICGAVCKSWKRIIHFLKKNSDVPICGLLIRGEGYFYSDSDGREEVRILNMLDYFCFKSKETINIQSECSIDQYIIHSGYDKGLLSNLSFDLEALRKVHPLNPDNQGTFFNFHRGLILLGLYDGTYEVHNVATKEVFTVPKSPIVTQHMQCDASTAWMRNGAIIELPLNSTSVVQFLVVRFSPEHGRCEVYFSKRAKWYKISMRDYNFITPCEWLTKNSVAVFQGKELYLYILTSRDHGIALQIFGAKTKKSYFTFPLPKLVHGDGDREFKFSRTRLWECDRSLHISYYDVDGMWLWKLHWGCGSTDNVENWNWIPQLVISNTLNLSTLNFTKTNTQKCLAKAIDAGHRVRPLTCHPDVAVIFILVNSVIYAYNLANDTLEKISDTLDYGIIYSVYLIKPCLRSLSVAKHGNLAIEADV